MSINPKPGILDILPYRGGEAGPKGLEKLIRLASNENALGVSPKAQDVYKSLSSELYRYPDGGASELRGALAKHYDIDAENIVCGSGSDELISLLVRAYAGVGDEVVYSQHGFLMYPLATKSVGAFPVAAAEQNLKTDVAAMIDRVTDKTKLVFIANPNNPTGSVLNKSELEQLHAGLPNDVILVIDAAYAEFLADREDYTSGIDLVEKYDNVVMLRTFSKIYGLAALRLGWAYCPPKIADVLNRIRGPFNVNMAAQMTGIEALHDTDFIQKSLDHNTKMLSTIMTKILDMGFKVYPSVGNFFLVSFGSIERAEEVRQILNNQGIFIRQMGPYGLGECLRVSIGTEEEMNTLVSALKEIDI